MTAVRGRTRRTLLRSLLGALFSAVVGVAPLAVAPAVRAEDEGALISALRAGGVAVLVRHAQTIPGYGDPPGFRLEDCATQRNLSEAGRAQAQRFGAWFKARGLTPSVVRNSPWCRARDTARLAFGRGEDWAALANLFEDRSDERRNTEAVRRFVAGLKAGELAVLVSHGTAIATFSGAHPAQGEGIVVRAQPAEGGPRLQVLGRIVVP